MDGYLLFYNFTNLWQIFNLPCPLCHPRTCLQKKRDFVLNSLKPLRKEEIFLRQKSRAHWIKVGDGNSKYFFNHCRGRWNSNKILALQDDSGATHTSQEDISEIAVSYFKNLIGKSVCSSGIPEDISLPQLSAKFSELLAQPFTETEILNTFKSMPCSKSPGPDGLTAEFFTASWKVIGADVTKAILHFFDTLHMPRMIYSTALCLVPKITGPTSMTQF